MSKRRRKRTSEQALAREYSRMNERKPPKRVKPVETPRFLTDVARGMFKRVAKYAAMPISLARAVVDRFRDKD